MERGFEGKVVVILRVLRDRAEGDGEATHQLLLALIELLDAASNLILTEYHLLAPEQLVAKQWPLPRGPRSMVGVACLKVDW